MLGFATPFKKNTMEKFTKDQLLEDANRLMKAHNVETIFAVNDGQLFLKKQDAVIHQNELNKTPETDAEIFVFGEDKTTSTQGVAVTPPTLTAKELAEKEAKEKALQAINLRITALQVNVDEKQLALNNAVDAKKETAEADLKAATEKLEFAKKELTQLDN
jgi:hypothetical protein